MSPNVEPAIEDEDYDYPALMRGRICGYDGTNHNHGHTDCWLFGEGADLIERQAHEIERLRGLVRSGHRMQLYNGQTRQPDGTMLHRTTALCLACDWHWRSGDPGDYLDIHAAHVDALLNPKEHR